MSYVVLDTNVLVSALWRGLGKGQPALLLKLCMNERYQTIYTTPILEEYREVIARPKFKFPDEMQREAIGFFCSQALCHDELFQSLSRPLCSDPSDQKFYDVTCCCDALLITKNKKRFPNDPRVLAPAEFFEHRSIR